MNQGASRGGKFFGFEVDQIREVIARSGAVLAPRFFAADGGLHTMTAAAKAAGESVRPRLVEMLGQRSKYFNEVCVAAEGLAALGAVEVVPQLLDLVEELEWEDGDFASSIERVDAFRSVVYAIGRLGGEESLETLSRLASEGPGEIAPKAIVALGRIGHPSSLSLLADLLDGDYARPASWALARIPEEDALEVLERQIASSDALEFVYENVMVQRSRLTNGQEVDFDVVEFAATVVESKKWEDIELHETVVELLAARQGGEWTALLGDYLHHEHARVRDAAIAALRERGELPELRWLDRPTTDRLFDEAGVEGLRDALTDRAAMFRVNALRKAVDEGVADELTEEACALVEFLTRFEHYTNGYAQDVHDQTNYAIRALAEFENDPADRLLCRLLLSGNAMYRKPFQYADELRERVLRFEDGSGGT